MPDWNIDDLLVHREWVGRVARTLVHGEAAADDLEQEAWVRAMAHPPAAPLRAPRGWLRSLLRFAAIDASRAARTRRLHEEGAAARERVEATPDSLVARAEILERLVHAVLALEEPYRGTVLLRYFEDLPPAEIARRQGVPVETVRTRLKRALERLRGRLGGGREGLSLLLAPLLPPAGKGLPAGAAGGIVMTTAAKVGIAAGAAALLLGGVVACKAMEAPPPSPSEPPPVAAAPPVASPPPAEGPPLPMERPRERAAPAVAAEPAPAGPTMEERLNAGSGELDFEQGTVGEVLRNRAEALGLAVEYADASLERICFATPFVARFQNVRSRDVLDLAVGAVPSPEVGKVLGWEVREERLFVLLREPPARPTETVAEVRKRIAEEESLLAILKSRRTTLSFDGNVNLTEVLSYLSALHGLNFIADEAVGERCRALMVKLTVKDMPLDEAMNELVRLDADLRWEVRGNVVLVRGR